MCSTNIIARQRQGDSAIAGFIGPQRAVPDPAIREHPDHPARRELRKQRFAVAQRYRQFVPLLLDDERSVKVCDTAIEQILLRFLIIRGRDHGRLHCARRQPDSLRGLRKTRGTLLRKPKVTPFQAAPC